MQKECNTIIVGGGFSAMPLIRELDNAGEDYLIINNSDSIWKQLDETNGLDFDLVSSLHSSTYSFEIVDGKIAALERIDADIVAPILNKLQTLAEWRLLVTPDHPTFIRTKTHTHGDVPFAMCGTGIEAAGFGISCNT